LIGVFHFILFLTFFIVQATSRSVSFNHGESLVSIRVNYHYCAGF